MAIRLIIFLIILIASNSVITYQRTHHISRPKKSDKVDLDSIMQRDSDPRLSEHVQNLKVKMFGTNKYRPIFKKDLEDFLCILWIKITDCPKLRQDRNL